MPPTYQTNGSTALVIGIVVLFIMYIFVWRKMKPVAHNHPRAKHPENEERLTDSLVRKLIRQNNQPVTTLDECEREISK